MTPSPTHSGFSDSTLQYEKVGNKLEAQTLNSVHKSTRVHCIAALNGITVLLCRITALDSTVLPGTKPISKYPYYVYYGLRLRPKPPRLHIPRLPAAKEPSLAPWSWGNWARPSPRRSASSTMPPSSTRPCSRPCSMM